MFIIGRLSSHRCVRFRRFVGFENWDYSGNKYFILLLSKIILQKSDGSRRK
jgi:hypothetical protein